MNFWNQIWNHWPLKVSHTRFRAYTLEWQILSIFEYFLAHRGLLCDAAAFGVFVFIHDRGRHRATTWVVSFRRDMQLNSAQTDNPLFVRALLRSSRSLFVTYCLFIAAHRLFALSRTLQFPFRLESGKSVAGLPFFFLLSDDELGISFADSNIMIRLTLGSA